MTSSTTKDSIANLFPYPTLTAIVGKPNAESIAVLESEIRANAAKVPSIQTGAAQAVQNHLGLVLTQAQYQTLEPNIAYIFPPVPPAAPAHGANATAAQIAENIRQHKEDKKTYREAVETCTTLANQIIAAVEDKFLSALKHEWPIFDIRDLLIFLFKMAVCSCCEYSTSTSSTIGRYKKCNLHSRLESHHSYESKLGRTACSKNHVG